MNSSTAFNKKSNEGAENGILSTAGTSQNLAHTFQAGNSELGAIRQAGKRNNTYIGGASQAISNTADGGNSVNSTGNEIVVEEISSVTRRGPLKAHHHKLPSAFSFAQTKKLIKPALFGQGGFPKLPEEDLIKKIDNLVDVSEYKQIQNLLSPLKMREGKVIQGKQKKLFSFHERQGQNSHNDSKLGATMSTPATSVPSVFSIAIVHQGKKQQSSNENPLNPLGDYIEKMQLNRAQLKEVPDILLDKINQLILRNEKLSSKYIEPAQTLTEIHIKKGYSSKSSKDDKHAPAQALSSKFKVKLEEMITLNLLKSNKNSGAIKKMLHVPTLAIFAVKEQPITSKEIRKSLRDWLHFWPSSLNSNEQFVRVYGTWWNVPEGCVSIIMEHMNGGSLQDLLENIGSLNERSLQDLAMQVISALFTLHMNYSICHGNLSPSQILFDKSGLLKLSLGISSRTQTNASKYFNNFIISSKNDKKAEGIGSVWSKNILERQEEQVKLSNIEDSKEEVFQLGLVLLISAIGSFDFLEDKTTQFFEQVLNQIEISTKSADSPQCCLLHDEARLLDILADPQQLRLSQLLHKFSTQFKDFLCKCLQYNSKSRSTVEELLKHPFLISSNQAQETLSLKELIQLSNKISQQTVISLPEQYQGASEKQLERVCEGIAMILPNCQPWFKISQYAEFVSHLPHIEPSNPFIRALALDLGLQPTKVHSKIVSTFESTPLFKDFKHKFIFNPC